MRALLLSVVVFLGLSGSAFAQGWEAPVWQTPPWQYGGYYYNTPYMWGGVISYDVGPNRLYYGTGMFNGFGGATYRAGNVRMSNYYYSPYARYGW